MIRTFVKRYGVDLSIAQYENINDYPTFNDFFIRKLKPHIRPIAKENNAVISPVDGTVSQIGNIQENILFQAKSFYFSLASLLGNTLHIAHLFQHGTYATFYLAPKDYHRVHMPIDGRLTKTIFIPGKLFSVNPYNTQHVPELFARNERLVCLFDTKIGPMAIILVGAMIVGSINTAWQTAPHIHPKITEQSFAHEVFLKKGDELGYFKVGSTVITLFPANAISWDKSLTCHASVLMGEAIAHLN